MAAAAGDGGKATSSAYETGGAGGKFRRRPFRRNQTTPYDRPPTALRKPSWLTKLVFDPATKLITSGAQRFFSSLFRKRILSAPIPLPSTPEARQESKDVQQEPCPKPNVKDQAGAVVANGHEVCNTACCSEDSGFSELEQLLKQKTFSRAEIDRLTELLRSKTVDNPAGNDESVDAVPVSSSRVPKGNVASPAELAKAYMGTRSSKVSPPILSSQNQLVRVDTPLPKNVAYSQNSPITSVTTKTAGLVGVRANGFTTPRSRGRSAIYHMARTPYFGLRQTDGQMASSYTNNAYSGPFESVLGHDGYFGSKEQPLKRRSSVLQDDNGSVVPMRRTRQKPNLLSHGTSRPNPGAGVASAAAVHLEVSEVGDDDVVYVHNPPKPSETAAKILDHLENLTPMEKSSESRLAAGKDRTPKKLTLNMLRGQALKSLESLDSPKLLQNAQDGHKLESLSRDVPTNAHDSSLRKQGKIDQRSQNKFINGSIVVAKNNEKIPFEDAQHTQPDVETADSLDKNSSAQPQKKHGFRMSAFEDSFELDEDLESEESAPQLAEGRDTMGASGTEQKPLSTDEVLNKPAAPFGTEATLGILTKRNDTEPPDAALTSVKSTSFLPSPDPLSPKVVPPSFGSDKIKEPSGDKVPTLLFSSSSPLSGLRPESSSSLSNPALGLAGASLEIVKSDNSLKDGKSYGKLEPLSSDLSPSTLFAAPSSTSTFSNGQFAPSPVISSTSNLTSINSQKDVQSGSSSEAAPSTSISTAVSSTTGNFASGGGLFGFAAVSSGSTEPLIRSGSSEVQPVSTRLPTTSSASNADLKSKPTDFGNLSSSSPFSGSSFASTSPGNSIFGLSSSGMSTVTTVSIQPQSSVFSTGVQSLVSAQTSSNGSDNTRVSQSVPAHFGSSTTSPLVGNSGMTSFSSVGSASSDAGTVSAAASDSKPIGSSSATFGNFSFGANSSASFTMGSSVSPSSTTQLAFGANPSVSAATTALTTSSNATSATFNFGVNSSSSAVNATDTSNRPSPSPFNFGGSSSASSLNNVSTSNSAAPGIFSSGGGSSTFSTNTISTSTTATPGIFGYGGSSSAFSTNTVSNSTSATPGILSFGASSSALSTNAVSTSTSTTPSIFNFGATSSVSSANAVNASSTASPSLFAFGASSASPPTSSTAGIFGSNFQPTQSPVFGSPFSSATPAPFAFGASSSSFTAPTTTTPVFGSAPSTPSGPAFSFDSTSLTNSSPQPIFGNPSPFTASPGNNNQMNMEDSMAEDTTHASSPAVPFGQPSVSPSPGAFAFGSTPPSTFQFGGQQNQVAAQNPSPFPTSGSFGAGGSFSLGSNGPDKSGRRTVKVSRNKNRKR